MTYFISLIKGIGVFFLAAIALYYGLAFIDRWTTGFKSLFTIIVLFPLALYSAMYMATKIIPDRIGDPWQTIVMVLVLICFSGIYKIKHHKKVIDSFQSAAKALGLEYHEQLKLAPALAENPALQRGFMPKIEQALYGKYRGVEVIIFNYQYEQQSSDYPDHYFRTVVAFTDQKKKLPEFYLKPQGLLRRIVKGRGIFSREDPKFSKRYSLTGPDEKAIKKFFSRRKRETLLGMKGEWAVGSAQGYVVIYADEKMDEEVEPSPKKMGAYLEQTWFLYDVLSSAGAAFR